MQSGGTGADPSCFQSRILKTVKWINGYFLIYLQMFFDTIDTFDHEETVETWDKHPANTWLESYLDGRHQCVQINYTVRIQIHGFWNTKIN